MLRHLALRSFFLFILMLASTVGLALDKPAIPAISSIASKNFWQLNDALALYQYATTQPWPLFRMSRIY